ncbi:MAG: ABC transporter ATP-binding protein [Candidatus Goldbacteria bacterium]|nr:ABC transporter ATP-binding protein [Candidatus Goldiibacteriota bacterium]HPD18361.1 ABC transporter ATP-binding protein [Candidatus Goldiibacteriota bacterium]
MIELKNVTKRFGNRIAVDSISFEVQKGEIVGFLGPNGAGKTTTMRIITGFFPPSEGEVKVAGIDVLEEPIKVKEKIGYMPENVPLYKELDVLSYLRFIAEVKGVPKGRIDSCVVKAMEEAGITDVKNRIIGKLSKGFRQRVGLAQAIINDPEVLILDEPTVGLDPKQIIEIRNLIKAMKGERTIILSTHILPEVSMTCDKVIVINEGKIVAQGDVKTLIEKSGSASRMYVEVDVPETEFIPEIKKIKGVTDVVEIDKTTAGTYTYNIDIEEGKKVTKDIVGRIVKNDWELIELKRPQVTLEDVFLKLVTKEDA